ncbi:MAG: YCF48-related protein [bacterium]
MKKLLLLIICISPLNSFAGNSWVTQYSSGKVRDISFPDSLHGWATEINTLSKILFTNDGGKIWNEKTTAITADSNYFFGCTCFANSSKGWVGGSWRSYNTSSPWAGYGWVLLSTTNGFNNYTITKHEIISHYESGGVLTIETIGGMLLWGYWECDINGYDTYMNGTRICQWPPASMPICFIDGTHGWVLCQSKLFKTTDSLSLLYTLYVNDIDFIDTLHGWAVGDTGKILYTNNGGVDSIWDTLISGVTNNLTCVKFVDSLNGWVGGNGIILRTRDGGQIWTSEGSYTVSKICAIDTTYAWALSGGNILKYKPYIGIEEPFAGTPVETDYNLSLSQNPFSRSTVITYSVGEVSQPRYVSLNLYDISGSCVKTLINELKPAGSYSTTLSANELKTGIYFLTLNAGKYKKTTKLILMK